MMDKVKIKRYYGLRLISLIYKILAVMTILIAIGAIGSLAIQFFNLDPSLRSNIFQIGVNAVIYQMLGLTIGAGLLALTFFVIAQVVDVLVSINDNLRMMARKDELQLSSDTGLQSSNLQIAHEVEQLKNAIEQQNRLLRLQVASQPGQAAQTIPPASTQQTKP